MVDDDDSDLVAGDFSAWLVEVRGAIRGERSAEVPCGSCTACCTSSQFIHIGPDETDTLAHIPKSLLFPAPRLPRGHVLMGYDRRGHCPMLVDDRCTIYEHRPLTCRTYDCRVFAAAGQEPDDKPLIADRARRWRFAHPYQGDEVEHAAVRAAANFLVEHRLEFPEAAEPRTQLAVLAIEIHDVFLVGDASDATVVVHEPDAAAVRVALSRRRRRPE